LVSHYNFRGHELSSIAGWRTTTGFAVAGQVTSSNVDTYLHFSWKEYISKLFMPLNGILDTFCAPSPKDFESLD